MPCTSQGLLCSPNILTCSETNTGWCAITATPSPSWPSGCCTAPTPVTTSSPATARRSLPPTPMLPRTPCPSEPSRSIRSAPPSAPSIEFPELGAIDPREHAQVGLVADVFRLHDDPPLMRPVSRGVPEGRESPRGLIRGERFARGLLHGGVREADQAAVVRQTDDEAHVGELRVEMLDRIEKARRAETSVASAPN